MTFVGYPLHPLTVHFPIAWYLLGVLLTLVFLWRGQAEVERFALWSFGLSWVATFVAAIFGLIDQNQLAIGDPRQAYVNNHITAAVVLIIINGLLLYLRLRWAEVLVRYRWQYLGLMLLGLAAVVVTGWLGGELVYRHRLGLIASP